MKVLGIRLEFIFRNTPEQNGHIESFHKTLKREYIWPYDFQQV
jgi:transposase InsO family protein